MMHGEQVLERRACAGVRWVRMMTDLPMAARAMARGHLSPVAYLRSLHGPLEFAIFAHDDPFPALVEAPMLFYLWHRRWLIKSLPSRTST